MKNIIIYSTPTCTYCKQAKDFLTAHNVAYTEYNVAADTARRTEMIEKSDQMGVPVIVVGDEVIVGFDQDRLAQAAGITA